MIYCTFFILYFSPFPSGSHSPSKTQVVEQPFDILLYPCIIFVFLFFFQGISTYQVIVFGRFRATTRALVVYTARYSRPVRKLFVVSVHFLKRHKIVILWLSL